MVLASRKQMRMSITYAFSPIFRIFIPEKYFFLFFVFMSNFRFFALFSLVFLFLVISCGNENKKERARIQKEITLNQDSLDANILQRNSITSPPNATFGVLTMLERAKSSKYDSLMSHAKIYRSRIDSLKRVLEALPGD
jgi:hypothetical protein